MNKKSFVIGIVCFCFCLIVIGVASSYAYFTTRIMYETSKEDRVAKITTEYLDMGFTTSQYISNSNLVLLDNDEVVDKSDKVKFKLYKKDVTYNVKYVIYLTLLSISDNMKSSDFKWELLRNGVSMYSGNFASAKANEDFFLTVDPVLLEDDEASFEIRLWLDKTDVDQSNLFNGSFNAKVAIDAISANRK